MCEREWHHGHHGTPGYHDGRCCHHEMGWGPGMRFGRRFLTREERIAWLEEYLKQLQTEAKAVEERIAELKAAG